MTCAPAGSRWATRARCSPCGRERAAPTRDEILTHEWSVRATEDTVRSATAGRPPRPKQRRRSAEMAALEEALRVALMTRVRIVGSERQGRIEVAYADADELERLAADSLGARNERMSPERIVVGMSGGVDSSVAAALLVEQGYDVVGVTLRVWPWREPEKPRTRFGSCCSPETVDDARAVARALGIPYYLLNSRARVRSRGHRAVRRDYSRGRTPVPCVACNTRCEVRLARSPRARAWDAAAVATGHYARIIAIELGGRYLLWRGRDRRKDQSDFLWPLTQSQLGGRALSGRRPHQGRGARTRRAALGARDRGQAGEPGDLLHPRRRLPWVPATARCPKVSARRRSSTAGRPARAARGTRQIHGRSAPRARTVDQSRPLYVIALDPGTQQVMVGEAADLERDRLQGERVNSSRARPPTRPAAR